MTCRVAATSTSFVVSVCQSVSLSVSLSVCLSAGVLGGRTIVPQRTELN